jgi:N-acetylmuramoyl-L-alanine amidase
MAKSIKTLVLWTLLVITFSFATCNYVYAGALGTGVVADEDSLNVRSGPGTEFSIVATLPFGSRISLDESNNGWYRIHGNGVNGWCAGNRIAQYESFQRWGRINAPDSNERSGPSSRTSLLRTLQAGTRVMVLGHTSLGWYYIAADDTCIEGWIYDGYISF